MSKTKECKGKEGICLFLLLENCRPLSPPWESQTTSLPLPPRDPGLLINLPRNWLSQKEAEYIKEEKGYKHNELSWSLSFQIHTYPFPLERRDFKLLWESEIFRNILEMMEPKPSRSIRDSGRKLSSSKQASFLEFSHITSLYSAHGKFCEKLWTTELSHWASQLAQW